MLHREDVDELRRLEEAMWRTETRGDRVWMDERLTDGFVEFGRSGRVYTRADILDLPIGPIDAQLPLDGIVVRDLGPDVALVTYRSIVAGEVANRGSVWRRTAGRWRLEFHQGTPA